MNDLQFILSIYIFTNERFDDPTPLRTPLQAQWRGAMLTCVKVLERYSQRRSQRCLVVKVFVRKYIYIYRERINCKSAYKTIKQ